MVYLAGDNNLEAFGHRDLHEMKVVAPLHLAQHDVPDFHSPLPEGLDGDLLTALDLPAHRASTRTKDSSLSGLKLLHVWRGP